MGLVFRGKSIAVSDVMGCVKWLGGEVPLVPWNPDGFKVAMCGQPSAYAPSSALLLSNNRGVAASLGHLYSNFLSLYRVRAHLHHYLDFMEGSMFLEAAEAVNGLVKSYEDL
jgi:tubulin epsilon